MDFPPVTPSDWRALVDRELAGKPFDKVLVHEALEGLAVAPLYTEAPAALPARELRPGPWRVCVRPALDDLEGEVAQGADALWLPLGQAPAGLRARPALASTFLVLDARGDEPAGALDRVLGDAPGPFALALDPLAQLARGELDAAVLPARLASLGEAARGPGGRAAGATTAMVSTLPYHEAGADAVEELALGLAAGACHLEALLGAGLTADEAASRLAVRVAVGRDTFVELCKVRALRVCWRKLVAAAGARAAAPVRVHAVCSTRTLSARDPWVNMLRATTQVFAAVLGGADLVTPTAFDQALGAPSPLGRRVARNTGLVLREESLLGQVSDPVGGSYYFETITDALARRAWARLQAIEGEGGLVEALTSGALAARLEAGWRRRLQQIATRKVPVLGVSEFANLGETLPRPPAGSPPAGGLPVHRDAAVFEALRDRADALATPPEAVLITLGTLAESRPRVGFAASFLAAGGIRTRESAADEAAPLACVCGPDERYASEGVERVRALKAAGCGRVLVAGRPGALEGPLREAGADGFIYLGCDAVAVLGGLLEEVFS